MIGWYLIKRDKERLSKEDDVTLNENIRRYREASRFERFLFDLNPFIDYELEAIFSGEILEARATHSRWADLKGKIN